MALIDIMSSDISIAGEADFAAAAATGLGDLEVPVNAPGAAGLPFSDSNGNEWFEMGDNINLARLWVNLPYGFGQGSGLHSIGVAWQFQDNSFSIITQLAGNSIITFPVACGPLEAVPLGIFIPNPSALQRARLSLTSIVLNVSMVNLPAVLEGGDFFVQYHLEVFHTKALVAAP